MTEAEIEMVSMVIVRDIMKERLSDNRRSLQEWLDWLRQLLRRHNHSLPGQVTPRDMEELLNEVASPWR